METEQLMMLLEAASSAGQGAFWLGMAYILGGYFKALLFATTVIGTAWVVSRALLRNSDLQYFADTVRREAGCPAPEGPVYRSERERVLALVAKGKTGGS